MPSSRVEAPHVDPKLEQELVDQCALFADDPYGWVMWAYPWQEKGGPLENHEGPDVWQEAALKEWGRQIKERGFDGVTPVMPVRIGVSSGHGPGKSTFAAWVAGFIMSTRPFCKGTVTANSFTQLETKTWANIQKWSKWMITAHWFTITSNRFYQTENKESWFCAPQSSKDENSESFAGQHAENSTSFYIFDEDSGISDTIHTVANGGLTDGEPMIFCFGNPTRNNGHFYRICFGSERHRWFTMCLDARESRFTNKELIQEWIDDYGEDSDFVRVRVKGLPPRASDLQFIDLERVLKAQKNNTAVFGDEPLIVGVDVSDGGSAWCVARFRRGADARTIPPIRIPGSKVRDDRGPFLARLADILTGSFNGRRVDAMFIDSAFGAPYVERLQVMGHKNVHEVRFGSDSPDRDYANLRAYMYHRVKEWLPNGMIDQKDSKLETDLTAPGFHLNKQDAVVIESKENMQKRGVAPTDDSDALALTFAMPVKIAKPSRAVQLPTELV